MLLKTSRFKNKITYKDFINIIAELTLEQFQNTKGKSTSIRWYQILDAILKEVDCLKLGINKFENKRMALKEHLKPNKKIEQLNTWLDEYCEGYRIIKKWDKGRYSRYKVEIFRIFCPQTNLVMRFYSDEKQINYYEEFLHKSIDPGLNEVQKIGKMTLEEIQTLKELTQLRNSKSNLIFIDICSTCGTPISESTDKQVRSMINMMLFELPDLKLPLCEECFHIYSNKYKESNDEQYQILMKELEEFENRYAPSDINKDEDLKKVIYIEDIFNKRL